MEADVYPLLRKPKGKLQGDSTTVQCGEPVSFLGLLTQHAKQMSALSHCVTVEKWSRRDWGKWCFLCTSTPA